MTEQTFWETVGKARKTAGGDDTAFLEEIREALSVYKPEQLVEFGRTLDALVWRAYRNDLWGAAYLLQGGCSDDSFEYFRRWLVSLGKERYEQVLKDPDSLADFAEPDFHELEDFAHIAPELYEEKTGNDDWYERLSAGANRSELSGPEWTEEELPKLFPKIAKLSGDA